MTAPPRQPPPTRAHTLAHAKLNLALAVGPARPGDGYHPIASWMVPIDLADEILLEPATPADGDGTHLRVEWADDALRPTPVDWPPERDLAVRALRLLERQSGRRLPARLAVRKRTPAGGGLGGGSADGAGVLRAGARLFDLGLGGDTLRALGAQLGSDVPYFLDDDRPDGPPRAAIVTGLGDRIERLSPRPGATTWCVLLAPPFGCPTSDIYRAFDALPARPLREADVRALVAGPAGPDPGALFNDLREPAELVRPELRALRLEAERRLGTPVHLSGSGSTLFAITTDGSRCAPWIEALAGLPCVCRAARLLA